MFFSTQKKSLRDVIRNHERKPTYLSRQEECAFYAINGHLPSSLGRDDESTSFLLILALQSNQIIVSIKKRLTFILTQII